jgi:hypothetical protein
MYNTWGVEMALKKITFHQKLVKIRSIWLPENIICNTKEALV